MKKYNLDSSYKKVAVIVPVHNEAQNIEELFRRLIEVTRPLPISWTFIFVDDCSNDSSVDIIKKHQNSDSRICIISLSRRFGKEAALSAGIAHSDAEAVIIMDADLQDPPECIPDMIHTWQSGYHVVAMRRIDRTVDSYFKKVTAAIFYRLMLKIGDFPIPENVGDFRLMSRKVTSVLSLLPESNRCMKGLFAWAGFSTAFVDYDRKRRFDGETKWSLMSLVKLAVDGITSHSIAPLRLATVSGVGVATFAVGFGIFTILKTLIVGEPVAGYTTILTLVTFLGGLQLLAIGLLGEYVGRIYIESKRRPAFVVDEIINTRKTVFEKEKSIRSTADQAMEIL